MLSAHSTRSAAATNELLVHRVGLGKRGYGFLYVGSASTATYLIDGVELA